MGMALSLSIIYTLPVTQGMALLIGIFVSAVGSGGITASLINIPALPLLRRPVWMAMRW